MTHSRPTRRHRGRGARERILAAATELFTAQGINATGMDQLSKAAEVSKRTLYTYFGSKDELVHTYLQELRGHLPQASGPSDEPTQSPREQLLAVFDPKPRNMAAPVRGCHFLNASVEIPDPEHSVHRLAATHKWEFARRLSDIARRAGVANPEVLGEQLALLYDGAAARGTALNSSHTSACARSIAELLVDTALAEAGPPTRT
ncbi:TetR/AcrR family transcriptional regulator [Streptomyces sp. NPDC094038]|uniref:TetR/AcrR family transcriptional regulator n=1 Tax=Streptomyces sp. NPDC094038 TaxID=3366055 RepID=UPI0038168D7F